MIIVEAVASVGRLHDLKSFRVTIAEWIGRPTVLEVDVALAVQIPDQVTLCLVDNDLSNRRENRVRALLVLLGQGNSHL